MCQRTIASSQLHPGTPAHTSKCMQSQTVLCHVWFPQGIHFGETHPLWEKSSMISPYSPNKFSKMNYKYSGRLAAGFSYASPQTCFAHTTTTDFAQRARALCGAHQTYPCQCCLSHHSDNVCEVDGLGYKNDMRVPVLSQITTPGEWSEENVPNTLSWFPLVCRIMTIHLDSPVPSQNVTVWPHICM